MATKEAPPTTQLTDLVKAVAGAKALPRGFVLKGEERYFVEKALEAIQKRGEELSLDISRHDADDPEFNLSALLDDLGGAPMFAAGRLVIVRAAAKALVGGKDGPLARAAVAWLADDSQEGSLVLVGTSLRADNVVVKAIKKAGGTLLNARKLYDSPPPWSPDPRKIEVVAWLVLRAKERKLSLDYEHAVYMVKAIGNDLFALDGELDKLEHSKGKGFTEVVEYRGSATPWSVAEDVALGDLTKSLDGIATLFRGGFQGKDGKRVLDAPALTAMILAGLRKSVTEGERGARALDRGATLQAASKAAGVPGFPKARESFEARMQARPHEDWNRLARELLTLERKSRSGAAVDANDFFRLALSWRRKKTRR